MTTACTIRPARREDGQALRALWGLLDELHAKLQPSFFQHAPTPRPDSELTQALDRWDHTILVAELCAELVGAVCVKLVDTPQDPRKTPLRRALVDDLVVDHGHRRGGVGQALMAAAADWGRRRGAAQVVLTVWAGNAAAEGFYRALGYSPVNQVLGLELDRDVEA